MQRMPRWRWTSPAIACDGTPASAVAWQARQFSFRGLPTRKVPRPLSSNFAGSYTTFSGTLKRWSSGFSAMNGSHAASNRAFMPSTRA